MKRALCAVIDRGGNSLASLALISLVATRSSTVEFGRFAFLMALSVALQSAYRAVPGSWLLVSGPEYEGKQVSRAAITLAVLLGTGAAAIILMAGVATNAPVVLAAAVGLQCAGAMLVDAPRLWSYASGHVVRPAALTGTSVVLFGVTAAMTVASDRGDASEALVLLFTVSSLVPVAVQMSIWRPARATTLRGYLRAHRLDVGGQLASATSATAAQVLVPTLLQVVTGPTVVGAVRGAQSLASVPAQLPTALQPVLLADTATKHRDGRDARNNIVRWTGVVSVLFATAIVVALALPPQLGERFFGPSWTNIDAALVGILASTWATSCLIAVEAAYRVRNAMRRFSALRTIGLALAVGGALGGALTGGAPGAAWALAAANTATLACALHFRPRSLEAKDPA